MQVRLSPMFSALALAGGAFFMTTALAPSAQAQGSARIANACRSSFNNPNSTDQLTVRQNLAMCTCFDRPLRAIGISPEEESRLAQRFSMQYLNELLSRNPEQKAIAERCMNEQYKKTR